MDASEIAPYRDLFSQRFVRAKKDWLSELGGLVITELLSRFYDLNHELRDRLG
tara:strand:- start:3162 stop:3320 length:159 start_codon:yes stop_codon:yes gene_type:complete